MSSVIRRFAPCSALCMAMSSVAAQAAAPPVDTVFVDDVSQGGRYEVVASTLAERRALAPDVRDLATAEVHDHEIVNAKLKKIAEGVGIPIAPQLNPAFQERLATLRAATTAGFDQAYIDDMKQIHDKDEKLFAKEAVDGTGAFKPFAKQTDLIVKRHIGALHGTDPVP